MADDGFLTDAELIRRLQLPAKVGRKALRELEKHVPGRRRFPAKDPLFGNRRFWPAVDQWLREYFHVQPEAVASAPDTAPRLWVEDFNATGKARKASRPRHSRPDMAPAE